MGAFKMEILNIVLALIIAILGYPVGLLIRKYTKEEMKPGRKYFIWLSDVLVILALIFTIYSLNLNIYISIIIALILAIAVVKLNLKPLVNYPIFALCLMLNINNQNIFFILSSILFIYGLTAAALRK
jgi:hypothetical protein